MGAVAAGKVSIAGAAPDVYHAFRMTVTQQATKVFPAQVRGPIGAVDGVAVVIVGDRLRVFGRGPNGRPRQVAAAVLDSPEPNPHLGRGRFTVIDEDGAEWTVTAGGGCGCGNPLKQYSAEGLLAFSA